jgi:hypothetical protein
VFGCVVIDGFDHERLLIGEYGPDGHSFLMASRGFPCPSLQLRQLLLDFRSEGAVPLFLFGGRLPQDALANLVSHER